MDAFGYLLLAVVVAIAVRRLALIGATLSRLIRRARKGAQR